MGFFDHQHYWRPVTDLNTVVDPHTKGKLGGLILQQCSCGAVRQIEFYPGKAPIVSDAKVTSK
jgi:hypothetical protein